MLGDYPIGSAWFGALYRSNARRRDRGFESDLLQRRVRTVPRKPREVAAHHETRPPLVLIPLTAKLTGTPLDRTAFRKIQDNNLTLA